MTKIAIIGAGLSGVTAARSLKDHAEITVFEKARGVSGRMATRRAAPYAFDHGAQYFTVRTDAFRQVLKPLIEDEIVSRWSANYVKFDDDQIIERYDWLEGEPRYVGVPGMNAVNKHLARDLDIKCNTRIVNIQKEQKWSLVDENGTVHQEFDWVISTAPAPQTLALMPEDFQYIDEVRDIEMTPCFALMLGFSQAMSCPFDAAHVINADISWLAMNSRKPGRHASHTIIIHSSPAYAQKHIDAESHDVIGDLISEAERITGQNLHGADHQSLHLWRYANNSTKKSYPVLIDSHLQLGACGDWCQGGRIEGAFISAYTLAEKITETLNHA